MPSPFILYVEDDDDVRYKLTRALSRHGESRAVESKAGALGILASDGDDCAGFLLDQVLPDGKGLDLLSEVRATFPEVPAMILTGMCEPELVNAADSLRARYLCKPPPMNQLEAFVVGALAWKREKDAPNSVRELIDASALSRARARSSRRSCKGTTVIPTPCSSRWRRTRIAPTPRVSGERPDGR